MSRPRTAAERMERRLDVVNAIGAAVAGGRSPTEAVAAVVKKFGVSVSTGWRLYKVVRRQWAREAGKDTRDPLYGLGEALRRRGILFRNALQAGDVVTALAIEQDRCKLLGLDPDSPKNPRPAAKNYARPESGDET